MLEDVWVVGMTVQAETGANDQVKSGWCWHGNEVGESRMTKRQGWMVQGCKAQSTTGEVGM
jgi:hypothetical protein